MGDTTPTAMTDNVKNNRMAPLAGAVAFLKLGGTGDRAALSYMVAAVGIYSTIPLIIAAAGGIGSPFLFNAGWRLGLTVGYGLFLWFWHRRLVQNSDVRAVIRRRILCWSFLPMVFNNFELALFSLSARYVDISVAAVIYELYHVGVIWLTAYLFRKEAGGYREVTFTTLLLMSVGFAGIGFVVFAQTGVFWGLGGLPGWSIFWGILLSVTATVAAACAAYAFKWSRDVGSELVDRGLAKNDGSADVFCVVAVNFVANAVCIPLNFGIGWGFSEQVDGSVFVGTVGIAILGGLFLNSVPSVFWRKANLITSNLGVNALGYATPVCSLLWLWIFGFVNVAAWQYLVVGTAAVITINLLINFEAEVRFGFKALILALWGCGAFVYLRDDFLYLLPFGNWLWPRETYLGALGLSATVFILLLTFRVARLAPRTQDEDNRLFALHRNLELLARRNLIDPNVNEYIRGIDSAHNPRELRVAYAGAKLCFAHAAAADHTPANRKLLSDAETQLNIIVHSRQQGVDFGELFSLIIFGGSTIALALLSRPEVYGWVAFLYEVFSVLFSAVVVFLIINVWDLHRERADLVLANQENSREYGVIFRDPKNRRFEQSVSVVIGLLIILAYAGLLWHKWLG